MPSKVRDLAPVGERILAILEEDARATYTEIAERADVSRPTVKKQIQQLEESGVIIGYSVDVNPKMLSDRMVAMTGIDVGSENLMYVIQKCTELEVVEALYLTNGDHPLVAKLRTTDTDALSAVLDNELLAIEGVVGVYPTILHERLK
jgi:Lrp/AsnC family transcriptional regulator for asnA, asnC and gidA